ncbi:MAG: BtaA family protein [Thiotrichales bacterium]|nr:BtaA family protein [Thiotrichales bacterium]
MKVRTMSLSSPTVETGLETNPENEQPTKATKELLKSAVNNTSIFSRKGLLDRLFTKWFDRLVYPQIWEDPEVDIQALGLDEHSHVFTISSGGCNALNYLTVKPESITVVDLNEAHIALIKLKLAAIQHLEQEAFFDFFGKADLTKNLDTYYGKLSQHLDEKTRQYWETKENFWSKPRIYYFTDGFYRHGLLGRFIGLIHWVCKLYGYDISKVMLAHTAEEQQALFNEHVAPVFETRLLKFLCSRSIVMYSLGIPPAQFDEMDKESKQMKLGMHELMKERARRLACDFPLETNYFAWQAFNRSYDVKRRLAVPRYLMAEHFGTLKQNQDHVEVFHQSMTDRLKAMPDNSLNAYLFLDAQDWMDENQLTELWQEVNRTAKPGARVVFRTAGEVSPLEDKLPEHILAPWQTDIEQNRAWTLKDRSAIYGGVHVYYHQ